MLMPTNYTRTLCAKALMLTRMGYAGQPPPLFELRRVRKRKGRAIAKRRRILLLFWIEEFKGSLFRFILLGSKTGSFSPLGVVIPTKQP